MQKNHYIKIAIFFIITAIILGAIASHSLKELIATEKISSFQTGVKYQFFHAISILFLSLNYEKFNLLLKRSLNMMIIGIFFFSFSIYLLSLVEILGNQINILGPITPLGGLILVASWLNILFAIKKND